MFWGMVLVLASLAGGLWFAYAYVTDSATLAGLIKAEVPRYLAGARLELSKARVRPFAGEINLTQVALRQMIDGSPFVALKIPWLHIRHSPRAMLQGQFVPSEVRVAQPTLRLRRRKDGTWNLQGLLADPWPGPTVMETPPILIQNGTVELAEGDARAVAAILRDVTVRIESAGDGRLRFEGSAKGDAFDRLALQGTIDRATGRVTLRGDMAGLAISETLRGRLPVEVQPACRAGRPEPAARSTSGSASSSTTPRPARRSVTRPRRGSGRASGTAPSSPSRSTTCRPASRSATACSPSSAPRATTARRPSASPRGAWRSATPRGRRSTCSSTSSTWSSTSGSAPGPRPSSPSSGTDFQPRGRISAAVHVVRAAEGGPVGFGWTVDCRDVAMVYRHFKYPLDHVRGRLTFEKQQIHLDFRTLLGGKPLRRQGTIDDPGPDAHVAARLRGGGAADRQDAARRHAPRHPQGRRSSSSRSGTVRGRARVERFPPRSPDDPPAGRIVKLDADLDLNERCAIKWAGLPYPVENLTGRLEVHPDSGSSRTCAAATARRSSPAAAGSRSSRGPATRSRWTCT